MSTRSFRHGVFRFGVAAVTLLLLPSTAQADEVHLKNGDHLSGKIKSLGGGSLTMETDMIGTVEIPFENVSTFSTDEPVNIHLYEGSTLKQKVEASELERTIDLVAEEPLEAQTLALEHVTDINPRPAEWNGTLTVGAEIDTGNTQERDYRVRVEGSRRTKVDRVSIRGVYKGERTKSSGRWNTTKREVEAVLQYDYFFKERQFAWVASHAEKDGIADIDLRLIVGAGHGVQWVERDDRKFNTQLGVTWVSENYGDSTKDDSYIAGRVAWRYEDLFLKDLKFFSNMDWFPSFEDAQDHYVVLRSGVRTHFTQSLFGEASVEWEWDSTPAQESDRQDVTYLFSLGWSF